MKLKWEQLFVYAFVVVFLAAILYSVQFYRVTHNMMQDYVHNMRAAYSGLFMALANYDEDEQEILIYYLSEAKAHARTNDYIASQFSGAIIKPFSDDARDLSYNTWASIDFILGEFYEGSKISASAMDKVTAMHAELGLFLDEVGETTPRSYFRLRHRLSSYSGLQAP